MCAEDPALGSGRVFVYALLFWQVVAAGFSPSTKQLLLLKAPGVAIVLHLSKYGFYNGRGSAGFCQLLPKTKGQRNSKRISLWAMAAVEFSHE